MRDLCELTGLSRQAIHFYIQQGLVPEGRKTGRNMAWYGPEHVERLRLVRRLQEERYLPLKAIRAVLDGETAGMAPAQRAVLAEVGTRLQSSLGDRARVAMIDAAEACQRHGVAAADLARMIDLGLVASREQDGVLEVSSDSLWLLDAWGQLRALGFSEELGFCADDLQIYEEAAGAVFRRETELIVDRLSSLPPDRAAQMIERALPLIHAILTHFHGAAVRHLLAAVDHALGQPLAEPPAIAPERHERHERPERQKQMEKKP